MVREMEQDEENYRSKLFHFKAMQENNNATKHSKSLSMESASVLFSSDNNDLFSNRSQGSTPISDNIAEKPPMSRQDKGPKAKLSRDDAAIKQPKDQPPTEIEQMKERFAKLLLGEDMSGGGKGVSSALALSNAITNLAASVFGEQWRLEPMSVERKARWRKEIDLLLSVTDYIVEFIMVTRQRNDLHMNIPALRKLDAMLIDCLDNFKDQSEFYYVSRDSNDSNKDNASKRKDDKWWLPTPKVPTNGLSENSRKFMQYQKDCVNQVLKAAMAINAQVLSEMEIPENYIESLPKNGRESLGDSIYRNITVEFFDPDQFLSTMDLSSEHKILDLKDRIEASIVIWKRKMNQKDGKSAWGSAVSLEKRELFEERAETILLILKHRFPGTPQSALDISKIQYNRDVGQAVLESYSRILESLAFTVMSRIEDVLYADYVAQNPSQASGKKNPSRENPVSSGTDKFPPGEETQNAAETPTSMTLLDFMNWGPDIADNEVKKESPPANSDNLSTEGEVKHVHKLQNIVTNNKLVSYLENIGGLKSPTARH
ncbi:rop guanine nucleotide exchange factor 12-like isoform X1 [Cucumis melo var. makuwa]|uniref:Rop guanine nucleotide exchange factor 12-like isoform X1 n=2 Tax=Cucumis melo var. makuwa TaxID=1194695 RepID=A0A5A7U6A7_CUCMM|nr:rop guanine nucleotide exchange factor 12-like isoform X1 [Cucumis melo var. makuwa]